MRQRGALAKGVRVGRLPDVLVLAKPLSQRWVILNAAKLRGVSAIKASKILNILTCHDSKKISMGNGRNRCRKGAGTFQCLLSVYCTRKHLTVWTESRNEAQTASSNVAPLAACTGFQTCMVHTCACGRDLMILAQQCVQI